MTAEEKEQNKMAAIAFIDGHQIQALPGAAIGAEWYDVPDLSRILLYRHRPKPKPADPQPWSKPEHVPMNCWLNIIGEHRLVIALHKDGVTIGSVFKTQNQTIVRWEEFGLHPEWQYSTDRKTWKPCLLED